MNLVLAQARFPAPEFENYTLPEMNLEAMLADHTLWRVGAVTLFLLLASVCFYRVRSRKIMLALALAGLAIFGYIFTACPCPVGMFQNILAGAAAGTRVAPGTLLLFIVPLVFALFCGRIFCAGACPLGAVQELLHWKTVRVPNALDRVLRMTPILLLLLFSVMAVTGMGFTLCYFDPYLPLFLLSFPLVPSVLTGIFLLLGLFISRPFCRYCCPYGALLRFFSLFAARTPQLTPEACIDCKLCEQGCPNGAILVPEPEPSVAVQQQGARRLAWLVALTPLALALGGLFGYAATPVVGVAHPDVRLLRELQTGEQTQAVEAFEISGASMNDLRRRVNAVENRVVVGMSLAGVIFSACVMAELIAAARRRKEEKTYSIDASLCVCCGRCYPVCPLNKPKQAGQEART